ncbi:hypothetical protein LOK49_LG15G00305 [Camellia lanceoleosa]|uniref:Uncharacterized protein n=1 Tax=Camellia lanceoleosa TaxID=1840588 RepID=A0ACC0FAD1_9ERIC|nr:hypothetical protein LOK49_LG15G00305 [Camellia lanceoleosa]
MNASTGSTGKHGKDLDEEASPLPVKHFDFLFEDKNSDDLSADDTKGLVYRKGAQAGCASVDNRSLQPANITTHSRLNGAMQQLTSGCDVAERRVFFESR